MTLWRDVKSTLKSIPVLGGCLAYLRHPQRGGNFTTSSDFWERRYRTGGTSGSGSYNRLAEFKAHFLNKFVADHDIGSVIEFGCGDGAQLKLATYPSYTGVDISPTAVKLCRSIFSEDQSKRFMHAEAVTPDCTADLALSLDVIFHLVEDNVFDAYMRKLFESAERFVIVYSSNVDRDWPDKHVRHRRFTRWIEQNKPEWSLHSNIKNAYPYNPQDPDQTSFADFYVFKRR